MKCAARLIAALQRQPKNTSPKSKELQQNGTHKQGFNRIPRTAVVSGPSTITNTSNNHPKSYATQPARMYDATSVPLIRLKPTAVVNHSHLYHHKDGVSEAPLHQQPTSNEEPPPTTQKASQPFPSSYASPPETTPSTPARFFHQERSWVYLLQNAHVATPPNRQPCLRLVSVAQS